MVCTQCLESRYEGIEMAECQIKIKRKGKKENFGWCSTATIKIIAEAAVSNINLMCCAQMKLKQKYNRQRRRTHHTRHHGVRLIQPKNACIDTKTGREANQLIKIEASK